MQGGNLACQHGWLWNACPYCNDYITKKMPIIDDYPNQFPFKPRPISDKPDWEGYIREAQKQILPVPEVPPVDMINKPPHYTNTDGFPEVIDVLMKWFPDQPLLWQVGKYLARWNRKDTPLENLKKARYYLNKKIKELDPKDNG